MQFNCERSSFEVRQTWLAISTTKIHLQFQQIVSVAPSILSIKCVAHTHISIYLIQCRYLQADQHFVLLFYFVVESVKFEGVLVDKIGTCVRGIRGSCGVKVRESSRSCHHYVYVCSIFITILSIFANLHALMLFMRINESSTHIRTRFGLRYLSLLYVCSAAALTAGVAVGGSITNIIGE